jgi:2-methylcitrate dehydratase PrpD
MSEENAEVTVETTETVESLKAALSKAEAKIVDMKKSTTPAEKLEEATIAPTGFDDNAFEKKYEEKKFFEANPDMLEYKDKLTEKTALGNSWADAKMLVESSDETIANRKIASQTNFTS